MECIPNDSVDRIVFFVAVDIVDLYTRETGLSNFTVNYVLDNAARGVMIAPTTAEIDSTNLPGLYSLAIDEAAMTNMDDANDSEILVLHITHASISPITMKVEVYRPKISAGYTLGINSDGDVLACVSNDDMVGTDDAALAIELAKVPKSDGTVSWNATALAAINAEVDTALDTAIESPTEDSVSETIVSIQKLIRADKVIDTENVPWVLDYKEEGTEEVLMSKTMKNTDDEDISSINNTVGSLIEEE